METRSINYLSESNKNIVNVFVTPRSGRDLLCGVEADNQGKPLLKIKVVAKPADGQANISVCRLISKSIGLPKSFVTVKRGHKSRYKQIELKCSDEKFEKWLASLL